MTRLTGLFQRGGSYYLRILLPQQHPLKAMYRNGRLVQTLGPCSHREAVIKGTIKRAEVLGATRCQSSNLSPPLLLQPQCLSNASRCLTLTNDGLVAP